MMVSKTLSELGFIRNHVFETIISTYGKDGEPHAAPMGVISKDMNTLLVRPYATTVTFRNLSVTKCAVVNITSDPFLFYKTVFKNDESIPSSWFEKSTFVNAPILKKADAYIDLSVVTTEQKVERAEILCEIKNIESKTETPRIYSRSPSTIIECLIYATKIKAFLNTNKVEDVLFFKKLLEHYDALVKRISPESEYAIISDDISKNVDSWINE